MSLDSTSVPSPERPQTVSRRVWLLPSILLPLAALVVGVVRSIPPETLDFDVKNLITFSVVAGTLLVLSGWVLELTSLSRRAKWKVRIAGYLILGALVAAFRLEDFSGDMVVKIAPRWAPKRDATLAALTPEATPQGLPAGDESTASSEFDYPQFLGPQRTGVVTNVRLARDWESRPPRELWRKEIGAGWSGFVIVGQHAVTQEQRGEQELVVCYDLPTGRVLWSHADPVRFTSVMGGDGPRATPAIVSGKVYAQGATGILNCLDLATGKHIWSHDIIAETEAMQLSWGRSGSPLVEGQLVIVSAGGTGGKSLLAFDKDSGKLVWSAGDDRASYASPTVATIAGVRQVLSVNEDWVVGHQLDDGQILWRHPWPGNSDSNANTSQPVVVPGDRVLLSKGYNIGSKLIQISPGAGGTMNVTDIWESRSLLKTKMTNVVVREGYAYGLSGGILDCVELEQGQKQWRGGRYGHGQIMLVGDLLLITAESGEVFLVEATPTAYRELTHFKAFDNKTWNNPALSGKYLLLRNHEEAACFELPLAEERAN